MIDQVEKLRNVYRNRYPNCETEEPPYDFIDLMVYTFNISKEEALDLNYEANKVMGRFNIY
jgi:hypothetical protein